MRVGAQGTTTSHQQYAHHTSPASSFWAAASGLEGNQEGVAEYLFYKLQDIFSITFWVSTYFMLLHATPAGLPSPDHNTLLPLLHVGAVRRHGDPETDMPLVPCSYWAKKARHWASTPQRISRHPLLTPMAAANTCESLPPHTAAAAPHITPHAPATAAAHTPRTCV